MMMDDVKRIFRSTFTCIIMGLTSYFGSLMLQCSFLWLSMICFKAYRILMDLLMYMWICTTVTLLEYVGGVQFRMYGDEIQSSDRAVIIMNHRTRLDWLYLYGVLLRFGSCIYDEKIVLKDQLKWIPGPGWAMQSGIYVFLVRKLDRDRDHVINVIKYLKKFGGNYKLLLFPEGTDLSGSGKVNSDRFADKNGLPRYEQVLHPRVAGFQLLVQQMMSSGPSGDGADLDAIYDMTVAYPEPNFATNELGLVTGRTSRVDFHCKRFSFQDVLQQHYGDDLEHYYQEDDSILRLDNSNNQHTNDDHKASQDSILEQFLKVRWSLKECILKKYYSEAKKDFMNIKYFDRKINLDSVDLLWQRTISMIVILGNVATCLWVLVYCQERLYYWAFVTVLVSLNGVYLYMARVYGGVDNFVMLQCLGEEYKHSS